MADRILSKVPPVDLSLDTLGRLCPYPILRLQEVIRKAAVQDVIEVISDDPGILSDMPAWCMGWRQECLGHTEKDGVYTYYVRKTREV